MPFNPVTPAHSPCRASGELLPALGMHQGKMDQEDGCESGWAAQRLRPKILLVSFITNICGSQWEHFKTLELTLQATTAEHKVYLFIYCYLLTENEFVSTLFKWRWGWECGGGRVCGIRSYYLPHAVEGVIFPSGKERSILNWCTAKPQQQLLQAGSITSWTFLKLRSQV